MSRVRPVLRSQRHGIRARILACAAMVACVAAAVPAAASAAPTLSLSVEPAVPGKGKFFKAVARGVAESPPSEAGPGGSSLAVFLNVAREPCAPTYSLEVAKLSDEGYTMINRVGSPKPNGPFEERGDMQNKYPDAHWTYFNGLQTGRFRFCGYLFDDENDVYGAAPVLTRLDFTVGGTCASSTAKVAKASKALKNANKALKRAYKRNRSARNARRLKQAKSKVKKVKRSLKRARSGRKALC